MPTYVARVAVLAKSLSLSTDDSKGDILKRIEQCLTTAKTLEISDEKTAKQALRICGRLMQRYNFSQADLIDAECKYSYDDLSRKVGVSKVNIANIPQGTKTTTVWLKDSAADLLKVYHEDVPLEAWRQAREAVVQGVDLNSSIDKEAWLESVRSGLNLMKRHSEVTLSQSDAELVIWSAMYYTVPSRGVRGGKCMDYLANAMADLFDCKCYTSPPLMNYSRDWVFYGIDVNTAMAALAFETFFNLIEKWVLSYDGGRRMYRVAVAEDILEIAKEEKQNEFRRAKTSRREPLAATEQPASSGLSNDVFEEGLYFASNNESQDNKHAHTDQKATLTGQANKINALLLDSENYWQGQGSYHTPSISSSLYVESVGFNAEDNQVSRADDEAAELLWRDSNAFFTFRQNARKIARDCHKINTADRGKMCRRPDPNELYSWHLY